ncbi:TPA: hypothetical protein N0F65_007369 [Lagenidium giganteum]|uniref:Uncharacterized protein n=1 Tax=Lagenidium giganteum TaxID=4803 RepID=A0AAV2YKB9_9STRA|nr:TPA: hypothetical protein N0F65_007369 [Lagenidium giganteum]
MTEATWFNMRIDASVNAAFEGQDWNVTPVNNTALFTQLFPKTKFKSLKQFVDVLTGCGNSRTDILPVNVSHYDNMTFENDEKKEGLTPSHHGPCEIWIDRHRVLREDDCRAKYTDYPAVMPVNYSVCSSNCTLTFYWLALHEPLWQVYTQCVPIVNSANGAVSSSSDASGSLDLGDFGTSSASRAALGSKQNDSSEAPSARPKRASSSKGFKTVYLIPMLLLPGLAIVKLCCSELTTKARTLDQHSEYETCTF